MDLKDVENLANLARIELAADEKKDLLSDMESILKYIKQIKEVKVEDMESEYPVYNIWREDKREPREFSYELITGQFPDSKDGFLKVKKIL
jgi:aspartyl-tRNA(Asn)/glutamyl-tRNA(Gln) amidotransferase subunit C